MTDLRRRKHVLWREGVTPEERAEIREIDVALLKLRGQASELSRRRYIIANRATNRRQTGQAMTDSPVTARLRAIAEASLDTGPTPETDTFITETLPNIIVSQDYVQVSASVRACMVAWAEYARRLERHRDSLLEALRTDTVYWRERNEELRRVLRLIADTPTTHEGKWIENCAGVFQVMARNAISSTEQSASAERDESEPREVSQMREALADSTITVGYRNCLAYIDALLSKNEELRRALVSIQSQCHNLPASGTAVKIAEIADAALSPATTDGER